MDDLKQFLMAVWRFWWSLLSCALFTVLGVYAAYTQKSNTWIVYASLSLAGVCLLLACFLAWREEHRRFTFEVARNQKPLLKGEILEAFIGLALSAAEGLSVCSAVLFFVKCWNEIQMPETVVLRYEMTLSIDTPDGERAFKGTRGKGVISLFPESGHGSIRSFAVEHASLRPQRYAYPQEDHIGFFVRDLSPQTTGFATVEILLIDALGGRHTIAAKNVQCSSRVQGLQSGE